MITEEKLDKIISDMRWYRDNGTQINMYHFFKRTIVPILQEGLVKNINEETETKPQTICTCGAGTMMLHDRYCPKRGEA